MLNLQTPEKSNIDINGRLDVHSVWFTIQGEGPFAGTPAVFVRLAGCNLQCPGCDTDYTSVRNAMSVSNLMLKIVSSSPFLLPQTLVVFTGGEPFRQNIGPIVKELVDHRARVQIETNGVVARPREIAWPGTRRNRVYIVVSPKTDKVEANIASEACAYKYVVREGCVDSDDGLPTSVLGYNHRVARPPKLMSLSSIYIQPEDQGDEASNQRNIKTAVDVCMKHGYRMCLQTHKYLGLP